MEITASTVFFDCPYCNRKHIPMEGANIIDQFNCPFCGKTIEVEDEPAATAKPSKPFNMFDWFKKNPSDPSKTQPIPNVYPSHGKDPLYNTTTASNTKDVDVLRHIYDVGGNDKVMMAAIVNPLFPTDKIQDILTNRSRSYLWNKVIRHHNCPPEAVVDLMEKNRGKDNAQTRMAIWSPHCPARILGLYLEQYLKGMDNETIRLASLNPDIPRELARKILEQNKNDAVSFNVYNNTSTPKDAAFEWGVATGRITDMWKIKKYREDQARWQAEEIKRIQKENVEKIEKEQQEKDESLLARMREQDKNLGNTGLK
jgi:hypothetical protein